MYARAFVIGGKGHHPEMAGLDGLGQVVPADLAPSDQVFGRDQESAVGPGSATCAAR